MISILAQERLLGASLGAAFTAFVVFEQRKRIYESISPNDSQVQSLSSQICGRNRMCAIIGDPESVLIFRSPVQDVLPSIC